MSRRTSVLVLALVQTATLAGGATAALARPSAPSVPPPAFSAPVEERELVAHAALPVVHVVKARAAAKPKPKPAARPKPVIRPKAPVRHRSAAAPRPRARTVARTSTPLTPEQRMMRAVNRIPGYHTGDAVWKISTEWGHWGVADLYRGIVYISPSVPSNRMYDVVAHEWSHVLTVKAYDGDVNHAMYAANQYFGGSDLTGAERAADCMARLLGASWTHYTSCSDSRWRDGARRLIARQRL